MSKELKRNDPCSCNSGKKYKNCCLNASPVTKMNKGYLLFAVTVVTLVGVIVGSFTDWETGSAMAAAAAIVLSIVSSFVNPPPSKGGGSPGAIDFGG